MNTDNSATDSSNQTLSFTDAAEKILRAEGVSLTHKQLAQRAIEKRLIETSSKTPEIAMHVSIRSEMKQREKRSEAQRFVFLENGLFTLVDLLSGELTKKTRLAVIQVKESRKEALDALYKKLTSTNQGANFEAMVADLLVQMGYQNVTVIGGKDDQGVDIICEQRNGVMRIRVAIQCKCKSLSNQIGPRDVSTLRDNISTYQCQQGILITTSRLNNDAKAKAKEAGKEPIHYIEHEEILDLFADHEIGIRSEPIKYHAVDTSKYKFLS